MRQIKVTIQGTTPLLMNRFTDANAEAVKKGSTAVIQARQNKDPRDRAAEKLYQDENGVIHVPGTNIFRAIIDAGVFVKNGKSKLTTQKTSLIPAGVSIVELTCPLTHPEGRDPQWEVDERSVVIPSTGGRVMAYRPRFNRWQVSFTVEFDDGMFAPEQIRDLVDYAGTRIGLCDFRPSRKGPYGKFSVHQWLVEKRAA